MFIMGKSGVTDFPKFFLLLSWCHSIIGTTDNVYELVCWNYMFYFVECRMQEASISDRAVSSDIKLSVAQFRAFIQFSTVKIRKCKALSVFENAQLAER